ncbi:MAG: DUF934 domain-containing protein [Gammaproteobacteria bacterium]
MAILIKNRRVVPDPWLLLKPGADGALPALPPAGDAIVPLALWQSARAALLARDGGLGVWLDNHQEPSDIAADLSHFAVIAVNFPKFADGRGYSIGRLLRERHGYGGELRAIGDILPDQMQFLQRCGFDAMVLRADQDSAVALRAFADFSDAYQATVNEPLPLFRRRLA